SLLSSSPASPLFHSFPTRRSSDLKRARELLYFGDAIDARTAVDIGMVNRVVPLAELREKSLAWAKRLSLISPEALYATKLAINRDRKSTRLNSSHVKISYAVFCLK